MKVWIAVLAILLLAFLVLRERFNNYAEALKSVGQTAGYIIPMCESGYTLTQDKTTCEKPKADGTKETKQPTCPTGSHYVFRETEANCEPDVGENPAEETTEPTCPTDYTFNRDEGACEKKQADGSVKRATGTCPAGKTINDRGRCIAETPEVLSPTVSSYMRSSSAAPVGGGGGGSAGVSGMGTRDVSSTCPPGYSLDTGPGAKCIKTSEASCPSEYTLVNSRCEKTGSASIPPTCSEGTFVESRKQCVSSVDPRTSTTTTSSTVSAVTGGSSGNLIGPTSGGVGRTGKNVWGPVFTGLGESAAMGGDSTRTNKYPDLLGGMMGRESSRIDGVGIVSPSQPGFGLDMGALPSLSSLGTEANARFFPFSRPGADPGFTADPYRLAKSYSTKNLSPKPDPVPFLTDFSAFFR